MCLHVSCEGDAFKMHVIHVGGILHAMDVNRYYGTHLKSLQCTIL